MVILDTVALLASLRIALLLLQAKVDELVERKQSQPSIEGGWRGWGMTPGSWWNVNNFGCVVSGLKKGYRLLLQYL